MSSKNAAELFDSFVACVDNMMPTSIHLECASITTMNMCSRNGPAKSIWMRDHGHSHGWKGAVIGAGRDSWQTEHDFTRDSI